MRLNNDHKNILRLLSTDRSRWERLKTYDCVEKKLGNYVVILCENEGLNGIDSYSCSITNSNTLILNELFERHEPDFVFLSNIFDSIKPLIKDVEKITH